ncbi:MAG: excinuclease ABC subunit UvrC, partial [bacterium]|nr:excinuclease ABC subunit UvrC [bacterium]
KHYPYLRLSINDEYPCLSIVRKVEKDKARYFGPYPNAGALREFEKLIKKVFPLRTCKQEIKFGVAVGRPCLYSHLKQCIAPCSGLIERGDYKEIAERLQFFLEGRSKALLIDLRAQMLVASRERDFEKAAKLRDKIKAIEAVFERQKADVARLEDRDAVGMARGLEEACVVIFHLREGKIIGRESMFLSGTAGQSNGEILSAFTAQHYVFAAHLPKELLIGEEPDEIEILQQLLSTKKGSKVQVHIPKRGEKKALTELASRNAQQILAERWARTAGRQELMSRALEELTHYLLLKERPMRIECYDISNISGEMAVGSMVVYKNGLPAKNEYRRFRIKWVIGANDYASLHE